MFATTSVAVHVTAVVPIAKYSGASFTIDSTPSASYVVGTSSATRFNVGCTASRVTLLIGVMRGGVVSCTVICCGATARLPEPSMAVQIMVLVPSVNLEGALFVSDCIPLSSCADA